MLEVATEKLNVVNAGGAGAAVPPLRDTPIPSRDSPAHGKLNVVDFSDTPTEGTDTPVVVSETPRLTTGSPAPLKTATALSRQLKPR